MRAAAASALAFAASAACWPAEAVSPKPGPLASKFELAAWFRAAAADCWSPPSRMSNASALAVADTIPICFLAGIRPPASAVCGPPLDFSKAIPKPLPIAPCPPPLPLPFPSTPAALPL